MRMRCPETKQKIKQQHKNKALRKSTRHRFCRFQTEAQDSTQYIQQKCIRILSNLYKISSNSILAALILYFFLGIYSKPSYYKKNSQFHTLKSYTDLSINVILFATHSSLRHSPRAHTFLCVRSLCVLSD